MTQPRSNNKALAQRLFRAGGTPSLAQIEIKIIDEVARCHPYSSDFEGIRYFTIFSRWIAEQESLFDQDREIAEIDRNRETALAEMALGC